MIQAKVSLEKEQDTFLKNYKMFGFKNKSSMIRTALNHLIKELKQIQLKNSAKIYSEIYENDKDLKELTDSAVTGWPE